MDAQQPSAIFNNYLNVFSTCSKNTVGQIDVEILVLKECQNGKVDEAVKRMIQCDQYQISEEKNEILTKIEFQYHSLFSSNCARNYLNIFLQLEYDLKSLIEEICIELDRLPLFLYFYTSYRGLLDQIQKAQFDKCYVQAARVAKNSLDCIID